MIRGCSPFAERAPFSSHRPNGKGAKRLKKKIPIFKTDRAAATFVDKADLTQYDLSGAQLTRFEIKPKDKSINLRLSEELYNAVRKRAARAGVPYQRFIRLTLERAIGAPK